MAYIPTQADLQMLLNGSLQYNVRVELLNSALQCIDSLEGIVTAGNINEDTSSSVRNTLSLRLLVTKDTLVPDEYSKLWINKFVGLHIGMTDLSGIVHWYKQGIYLLNTFNYSFDSADASVEIGCEDMMSSLNGTRNGELLSNSVKIDVETNVRQVIVDTVTQLGKVAKYRVDDVIYQGQSATVPYDITLDGVTTVADILDKLATLFYSYEYFFDEDGVFVFQAIPTCENDDIMLDASILSRLVSIETCSVDITKIRNHFVVYGLCKDDNTQIKGEYFNENPDSPYNVMKLGHLYQVLDNESTKGIYTDDLAVQRAEYECWKSNNLTDSISLETPIVPWLHGNQKIRYQSLGQTAPHDYIVKSTSKNFESGTMTIEAVRFYPLYPFVIS